jgi:hypothetical protein
LDFLSRNYKSGLNKVEVDKLHSFYEYKIVLSNITAIYNNYKYFIVDNYSADNLKILFDLKSCFSDYNIIENIEVNLQIINLFTDSLLSDLVIEDVEIEEAKKICSTFSIDITEFTSVLGAKVRLIQNDMINGLFVDTDLKIELVRKYYQIANKLNKPVMVHDRDAHLDALRILDDEKAQQVIFHCYSGDKEFAQELVKRGWYLSFAGTCTFKNAQNLREALQVTPLENVLVETDAPFLTPMPYRGYPNSSYMIPLTLATMAQEMNVDINTVADATRTNAEKLFGKFE